MNPILRITDGTTSVDLVKRPGGSGFYLKDWSPTIAEAKGGGVWSDSPLAEGRQLADEKLANVVETYTVAIKGQDENALIREDQDLLRLFEKAKAYWRTNWQTEKVWIEARSPCETNTRYAMIHYGKSPSRANPYAQPFLQVDGTAVMDELALIIERGQWQGTEPGTGTGTQLSNPGRTPTTGAEVYVGNHGLVWPLTHIYISDGGVFSANLIASTDYALLPATPLVNDAVYFGVQDFNPFSSLVFDLIEQEFCTIVWEYLSNPVGPAFSPLVCQDNTAGAGLHTPGATAFDTSGVYSVHWRQEQAPAWVQGSVNGVNGMWVRAKVTAVAGGQTPPYQQNRAVYTIRWPYVQIEAAQVGGDIPALLRTYITNVADYVNGGATTDLVSLECLCGLRSVGRGTNFNAFINLTVGPNPTGAGAVVSDALAETADTLSVLAPAGSCWRYTATIAATPADPARRGYIDWGAAYVSQWYGRYRAFLRCLVNTAPVNGYVTMCGDGDDPDHIRWWTSLPFSLTSSNTEPLLVDLGQVNIGPSEQMLAGDWLHGMRAYFWLTSSSKDGIIDLYDFILMPIDEFSWDVSLWSPDDHEASDMGSYVDVTRYYDVDGLAHPKAYQRAFVREHGANEYIVRPLNTIGNGPFALQANRQQRLWFLFRDTYKLAKVYNHEIAHKIQLWHTPRYLAMRGDR